MTAERYEGVISACGELIRELEMPILLSNEEIDKILVNVDIRSERFGKLFARAQLKKVVAWGEEECFEHPYESELPEEEYNRKRHRCPECLQSLKKEAGL